MLIEQAKTSQKTTGNNAQAAAAITLKTSTGWPKTVSHYQGSSLSCIKNRQCG